MTDFPTKVKVGWRDYKILEWDLHAARSAECYGETRHIPGEIAIDRTHPVEQQAETLTHEILHVIFRQWSIQDDIGEERTVGALSNGLASVIRDNPDVWAWIQEGLAQK